MTTINDLPFEILLMVFENTQKTDLLECHKVCQSWYSLAHITLLQNVTLKCKHEIEQFVDLFNKDTNPLYMNAVKTLHISVPHSCTDHYTLDQDKIQRLFSFSNLTEITIDSDHYFFANFNDDICKNIVNNCPKLNQFNTECFQLYSREDLQDLYKIRLLVNSLHWHDIFLAQQNGTSAEQFLAMFPRLQIVSTGDLSFDQFLPVVQYLSKVQRIELGLVKDTNNFAETYMTQQTAEIRDLIVRNLSLVTSLSFTLKDTFCVNSIKFASRYFTGLKTLTMVSGCAEWTDIHEQVFCVDILDLVASVKESSEVVLAGMERNTLKRCLPVVLKKLLHDAPASYKNNSLLELALIDYELQEEAATLILIQEDLKREIGVVFGVSHNVQEDISYVLDTPLDDIEEFKLSILCEEYVTEKVLDVYSLLEKMPNLKSVVLEVPDSFAVITELLENRVQKFTIERAPRESVE